MAVRRPSKLWSPRGGDADEGGAGWFCFLLMAVSVTRVWDVKGAAGECSWLVLGDYRVVNHPS
jgi:hypothetical protein